VPYIPKYQVTVGTGLEYAKWGVFVDASYVGETFTTASNTAAQLDPNTGKPNANFGKTDSYFVVDVSTKYKLTADINAFVNLSNITNAKYIVSRHPIGARPGRPFAVGFGLETRF
jgi:Fe(3+) dicitrate transport protein